MNKFLIIGPARSGSTALRHSIAMHPDITCHGEVLAPNRVLGLSKASPLASLAPAGQLEARDSNLLEFVSRLLDHEKAACGFKVLYSQLLGIHAAEFLDNLMLDDSWKIIFLWRKNLAKRYISEQKFRANALSRTDGFQRPEKLSVEKMFQDCRNHRRARETIKSLFPIHERIEFVYEDLLADREIPRLNTFLQVRKPMILLSSTNVDVKHDKSSLSFSNEKDLLEAYDSRAEEFA